MKRTYSPHESPQPRTHGPATARRPAAAQTPQPATTPKSTAGFTLLELLVVIAIIGILAALILGVLGNVRKAAEATTCISNLRQSYLAHMNYANEHNGVLVDISAGINHTWATDLIAGGYAKDAKVFRCPSEHPAKLKAGAAVYETYQTYAFRHYGLLPTENWYLPIRLLEVQSKAPLSQVLFLVDSIGLGSDWVGSGQFYRLQPGVRSAIHVRHNGRANAAFFDGSIRQVRGEELSPGQYDWGWDGGVSLGPVETRN